MSKMTDELGVIDYRKNGHVIVTEGENNTFIVTLKFFFNLTAEEMGRDYDKLLICSSWCSKWTSDQVKDSFSDIYKVHDAKWLEPTVFQMKIDKPTNHRDEVYSLDQMYKWLRYDCLEDTLYEGDIDNNFWRIPYSEF